MNNVDQSPTTTAERLDTIGRTLQSLIEGQPLPSFGTAEFRCVVSALSEISGQAHHARHRDDLERLGLRVSAVLLNRLQDSMRAERDAALALMDGQRPH